MSAIVRAAPKGTRIRFNLSCVFHCPFEGVVPDAEALDWIERVVALDPSMEIALADTTGNAAPDQVRRIFERAHRSWGERFAFHGHDTYGMGLANVTAAWEAGCRVFDAASGGIGGCPFAPGATGNVAMEDVVWLFNRMGVETGTDWTQAAGRGGPRRRGAGRDAGRRDAAGAGGAARRPDRRAGRAAALRSRRTGATSPCAAGCGAWRTPPCRRSGARS